MVQETVKPPHVPLRLVFDTSTSSVSLGIWKADEGWVETVERSDLVEQQSKVLLVVIKEMMKSLGIETPEIEEIAVGKGPGSYTGLRMGFTVAKLWAHSQSIPLFTFSSKALLEKSKTADANATFPKVGLLVAEDFEKVESLESFAPVYENDNFAQPRS